MTQTATEIHLDTPLRNRNLATSIGASAARVSRWIGSPSATRFTRRSASEELDRLINDAQALKSLLGSDETADECAHG